jgi:chloride channel protein, CIC family
VKRIGRISRKFRQLAWGQLARRSASENAFLALLPVVGVVVGLITVVTSHFITFLQNRCWGSGLNMLAAAEMNPWWVRILVPLAGGLIVGAIGLLLHVRTRGGGITTIMQAIALKGGNLSLRQTWPRDLAAMFTIATGGSLGREGAMAMLASAVSSRLGRQFHLNTQQLRLLVCAAAAAALAAVYNAPIGGSLFALELLMGNFALDILGPVVVVSVISTVVFRSCMGNLPRFVVPHYDLVSGWELPIYLVLGVLAGVVSLVFVRAIFTSEDLFEKLPVPRWLKPAIGMALVGVLGVWWPHVFGNGFEAVNQTLGQQFPLKLLLILLPIKILASSLTFGAGGAGGLFTPSLMVGALLGGVFGYGAHALFPGITAGHGAYALVGMAGLLAGTTHAPLTAIMMIFEQTNNYQIVLPLMFVAVISHFTVRLLRGRSLDEESFRRRGIVLPRDPEESIMQSVHVADVMHTDVTAISQTTPFRTIVAQFLKEPYNHLYVTDETGKFLGAIRLHAIKEMLSQQETLTTVIARDLVDDTFDFVTPDQRLADTMDKFWSETSERLPVLDSQAHRKLIAWISKRDLIGIYSQEILKKRQLLGRFRVKTGDEARDVFVELPEGFQIETITIPATYAGRTLGQLALRSKYNLHVLQIKHRHAVTGQMTATLPSADLPLNPDDQLIVIGPTDGLARLQLAMYSTAESDEAT